MNDLIEKSISQDPITGLFRKVKVREFSWSYDQKTMTLHTQVSFYAASGDTEPISAERFRPYSVMLNVNNGNKVDANGDVTTVEEDIIMGEYDFYIVAAKSNMSIFTLMEVALEKADASGRYNV